MYTIFFVNIYTEKCVNKKYDMTFLALDFFFFFCSLYYVCCCKNVFYDEKYVYMYRIWICDKNDEQNTII